MMRLLAVLGFFAYALPLFAEVSVSAPEEIVYDGLYVDVEGEGIVRLSPMPSHLMERRLAYYVFDSSFGPNCEIQPDYSGMETHITQLYKGKSFFRVRAGYLDDILPNSHPVDQKKIVHFFSKGEQFEIKRVALMFMYDKFVGDSKNSFYTPDNIDFDHGLTGQVPCSFFDGSGPLSGGDPVIVTTNWGFYPDQHLLRVTMGNNLTRFDFSGGPTSVMFHRPPFQLPAEKFDIKSGGWLNTQSLDVPFDACGNGCNTVGFLIETNSGFFVALGSDFSK